MKTVTIPAIEFSGTVYGKSLQHCVNRAVEQCEEFFGDDREYTLEPLSVEPRVTLGGTVADYEASFRAHAT